MFTLLDNYLGGSLGKAKKDNLGHLNLDLLQLLAEQYLPSVSHVFSCSMFTLCGWLGLAIIGLSIQNYYFVARRRCSVSVTVVRVRVASLSLAINSLIITNQNK